MHTNIIFKAKAVVKEFILNKQNSINKSIDFDVLLVSYSKKHSLINFNFTTTLLDGNYYKLIYDTEIEQILYIQPEIITI